MPDIGLFFRIGRPLLTCTHTSDMETAIINMPLSLKYALKLTDGRATVRVFFLLLPSVRCVCVSMCIYLSALLLNEPMQTGWLHGMYTACTYSKQIAHVQICMWTHAHANLGASNCDTSRLASRHPQAPCGRTTICWTGVSKSTRLIPMSTVLRAS